MTPNNDPDGWTRSATIRRRAPEATVFVTVCVNDDLRPQRVHVAAGKAGSATNSAADGLARLAGAALRAGQPLRYVADLIAGIRHDRSNGHEECASLSDAVASGLLAFDERLERPDTT